MTKAIARTFVAHLREGHSPKRSAQLAARSHGVSLVEAIEAVKAVKNEGITDLFKSKKKQAKVPDDRVAAVLKRTTLTQDARDAEKEWRGKNAGQLFDPKIR